MVSEATLHLSNIAMYSQRYLPVIASMATRQEMPDYTRHFVAMENLLKSLVQVNVVLIGAIAAIEKTRFKNMPFLSSIGKQLGTNIDLQKFIGGEDEAKSGSSSGLSLSRNEPGYYDKGNISTYLSQQRAMSGQIGHDVENTQIWGPDIEKGPSMISRMGSQISSTAQTVFGGLHRSVGFGAGGVGGMFSLMGKELKSLGTSSMKTALVMAPIQKFMGGFMEPFGLIGDIFGDMGEVLGTMFYPAILPIVELLGKSIPYLMMAADFMGPLVRDFFMFLTPLGLVVNLLTQLSSGVSLDQALSNIGDWFLNIGTYIVNWLAEIDWGALGMQLADQVIGFFVNTDWGAVGTALLTWAGSFISNVLSALGNAVGAFGEFAGAFVKKIWDALAASLTSWFK